MVWSYQTPVGTFLIVHKNGRWVAMLNDENLGNAPEAWQAAYRLANDEFVKPVDYRCGELVNPSDLGIPEDIREWTCMTNTVAAD